MLPEEPSFAQVLGLSFDEEDYDFESAGYDDFEEDEEYDEDEDEEDEEDEEESEDDSRNSGGLGALDFTSLWGQ